MLKEHGQVDRANLHSEDHESAPQIAFFGAVAESLGPFQAFQVNIGWPRSFLHLVVYTKFSWKGLGIKMLVVDFLNFDI